MFRRDTKPTDEDKNKKRRELKVLFVSKRDTCRGPMAEAILNFLADKYSMKTWNRFTYRVNSAGFIKYNQGYLPEQLALRVLAENHLETLHGSRQLRLFDFTRYDYILCFDPKQLEALVEMAPMDKKARLYMVGAFQKGQRKAIEDPYETDLNNFRICFEQLYIACEDFYFQINEKRLA